MHIKIIWFIIKILSRNKESHQNFFLHLLKSPLYQSISMWRLSTCAHECHVTMHLTTSGGSRAEEMVKWHSWPSHDQRIGMWCEGQVTVTWLLKSYVTVLLTTPSGEQSWGDGQVTSHLTLMLPKNWYLVWGSSDCHRTAHECHMTMSHHPQWEAELRWRSSDNHYTLMWPKNWYLVWGSRDSYTAHESRDLCVSPPPVGSRAEVMVK